MSVILVSELPPSGDTFEMVIGYQSGVRNESRGPSGLASIASRFLASTPPARALSLSAYASGGEIEFLDELDRTAIRISVPQWAAGMLLDSALDYFNQTPARHPELVERARAAALNAAAPRSIEDEIRMALLGSHPYHHPIAGWRSDIEQITNDDIGDFFADNYGTDRAFVLMTPPVSPEIRDRILAVPARTSRRLRDSTRLPAAAQRTIHLPPEGASGGVIFASPVPGVFYRGWYSVLVLDRLIRRVMPGMPETSIVPSIDPYYWRLRTPVPPGQFAEVVEENLLQEMNRLQFTRPSAGDLDAAKRDAMAFLNLRSSKEWYASFGIENRREEGLQWIQTFTPDDIRAAARDLVVSNRVIVSWSPRATRNSVQIESLDDAAGAAPVESAANDAALGPVPVRPFPAHSHPAKVYSTPEKLASGIWIAASAEPAVFLAGSEESGLPEGNRRTGANGTLWRFDAPPDVNTVTAFQKYRADRILVLTPEASLDRARSIWGAFRSNAADSVNSPVQGKVANIDLPALVVLKAALDRKLIEAGWWHDASIRIDAAVGATLAIEGPPAARSGIREWIAEFAAAPMNDADLAWTREVAVHHLNDVLADVQILLWQRVPDYILQDVETVTASHVQDVAKLYF